MHALDRLTGITVWEQDAFLRRRLSGPVAVDRYVLVSDFDGFVHILRKSDGQPMGRSRPSGGGFVGEPLVVGDRIYIMNKAGDLVAISVRES